jgi:hypothetical protein
VFGSTSVFRSTNTVEFVEHVVLFGTQTISSSGNQLFPAKMVYYTPNLHLFIQLRTCLVFTIVRLRGFPFYFLVGNKELNN